MRPVIYFFSSGHLELEKQSMGNLIDGPCKQAQYDTPCFSRMLYINRQQSSPRHGHLLTIVHFGCDGGRISSHRTSTLCPLLSWMSWVKLHTAAQMTHISGFFWHHVISWKDNSKDALATGVNLRMSQESPPAAEAVLIQICGGRVPSGASRSSGWSSVLRRMELAWQRRGTAWKGPRETFPWACIRGQESALRPQHKVTESSQEGMC